MFKLFLQRVGWGLTTLLAISLIVFAGTQFLPGDVVQAVLGQGASQVDVVAIRRQLGLDVPAPERYVSWLFGLLRGDLGKSLATGLSIADSIAERLPYTLLLAGCTAALSVPIAVGLGLVAAAAPRSALDRIISTMTVVFLSGPEFLVGTLLVVVFAVKLRWLPAISYAYPPTTIGDHLRSITLPVLTLAGVVVPPMTRMTRSAVISVMNSPAIEMATFKGLTRRHIVLRHALPNALPPIITVVALNLAYLVTGVLVVEAVFNYPGLAKLLVDAVSYRDIPVVQACAMVFCAVYVSLNVTADLLALAANPKRRYPR